MADPKIGDYLVYHVLAAAGPRQSEWLVILRRTTAVTNVARPTIVETRYLSSGREIVFSSREEQVEVTVVGGSSSATSQSSAGVTEHHAVVGVPFDFLRAGFVETAKAHIAVNRSQAAGAKFNAQALLCLDQPPSAKLRADALGAWKATKLSEAEQTDWARGFVSFMSFFELVTRLPELDAVTRTVVALPAGGDLLRHAIRRSTLRVEVGGPSVRSVSPAALGLMPVESPTFFLPYAFYLGASKLVRGYLVVTGSDTPLDLAGGVLQAIAIHPNDESTRLDVQLIGSIAAD